jgi:hypothetical protein
MLTAEIKDSNGRILAVVALPERVFKTGSRGYYGTAKGTSPKEGERLQLSVQAVVIGSKPKP